MEQVIIESDSLPLIQAIKSRVLIAEANAILRDIHQLSEEIPNCGFTWMPREGNRLADVVAGLAAMDDLRPKWVQEPPIRLWKLRVLGWGQGSLVIVVPTALRIHHHTRHHGSSKRVCLHGRTINVSSL
ncbi:hypothetical protein PIB30_072086 [Stylosanthes scabra]|uniref:RNase H type-1 domain-containing protein n=1 Tax=Stylosanthes scabra TaxID=79078 RepID=A0ABU6RPJ3_9FABA|nr:hypothetical protein [Stylosanthes scabra]